MGMENRILQIESIIADEFNVPPTFRSNRSRITPIVFSKKALCLVLYKIEGLTHKSISDYIGYRDHTGSIHHTNGANDLYATDQSFKLKIDRVLERVTQIYYKNSSTKLTV